MEVLMGMASAFGVFVIFSYIPLHSYSPIFRKHYSPKLMAVKLMGPFDGLLNLFVILGSLVGLMAVTGIGMIIHNCIMVLSISGGIWIMKKWLVPKWQADYERLKAAKINELSSARRQHA
jgi:hypothetical protein